MAERGVVPVLSAALSKRHERATIIVIHDGRGIPSFQCIADTYGRVTH